MKKIFVRSYVIEVEVIGEVDTSWGWTYEVAKNENGYYMQFSDNNKQFVKIDCSTDEEARKLLAEYVEKMEKELRKCREKIQRWKNGK